MQVTYVGPFDEVEVPALGLVVKKGRPFFVDNELGEQLCKQDVWEQAGAAKSRKASKPVTEGSDA